MTAWGLRRALELRDLLCFSRRIIFHSSRSCKEEKHLSLFIYRAQSLPSSIFYLQTRITNVSGEYIMFIDLPSHNGFYSLFRHKTREIISINSEADSNTFCYDSITYCVQNLSCLVVWLTYLGPKGIRGILIVSNYFNRRNDWKLFS